jgi:hypothetical protein
MFKNIHDFSWKLFSSLGNRLNLTTQENTSDEKGGGAGRDRTDDILLAKQALSQLSYSPDFFYPS